MGFSEHGFRIAGRCIGEIVNLETGLKHNELVCTKPPFVNDKLVITANKVCPSDEKFAF